MKEKKPAPIQRLLVVFDESSYLAAVRIQRSHEGHVEIRLNHLRPSNDQIRKNAKRMTGHDRGTRSNRAANLATLRPLKSTSVGAQRSRNQPRSGDGVRQIR